MDSFENCVKIAKKPSHMGGKIGPKSRKSVPGGTPKWRQEAKMIKRGGPFNYLAILGAIFEENGLQNGCQNDQKSIPEGSSREKWEKCKND